MNILYSSSDSYSQYTGISMLSLFINNKNIKNITVYILDWGISNLNKERLISTAKQYNRKLIFIDANKEINSFVEKLNLKKFRGSLSPYGKIFPDIVLPNDIEKILYIDSDTIINGPLMDLYNIDIEDYVFAAVVGVNFYDNEFCKSELNITSEKKNYYNSGVILYNLYNWRKMNIKDIIIKACLNGIDYKIADQSILYYSIPDSYVKSIPPHYNYWGHIYPKFCERFEMERGGIWSKKEIENAIKYPIIIHYKGKIYHPWIKGCFSREKNKFLKYKDISYWKKEPLDSMKKELQLGEKSIKERLKLYKMIIIDRLPFVWLRKFQYRLSIKKHRRNRING